ncbi:hypothetical protein KBC03_07125 [Patescibacteria group bacterium]|nr:hypothetical protein [Patescibacteria group bacterium]
MFAFILGFIFLFVVYGYRFDTNTKSFVTQNVFVSMNFFSDDNTIVVDGNVYEPHDHQVNFYNLEPGCYTQHFAGQKETHCYENNQMYEKSFVQYLGTKPYVKATFGVLCSPISSVETGKYNIGTQVFADPIESAFAFNKVHFLQVSGKLLSCNSDYSNCKELAPVQGDVVCGNKQGLVSYNEGKYELIQLK